MTQFTTKPIRKTTSDLGVGFPQRRPYLRRPRRVHYGKVRIMPSTPTKMRLRKQVPKSKLWTSCARRLDFEDENITPPPAKRMRVKPPRCPPPFQTSNFSAHLPAERDPTFVKRKRYCHMQAIGEDVRSCRTLLFPPEQQPVLEAQSGSDISSIISEQTVSDYASLSKILASLGPGAKHVELLVTLISGLATCTHYSQAVHMLILYMENYCESSISATIVEKVMSCFTEKISGQSGPLGDTDPDWLIGLREAKVNYELFRNNEAFSKVSALLSTIVSMGLCSATSMEFSIGGAKLFSPIALTKQAGAIDLVGAIADTVVVFAEGGYACFQSGSLSPLLLGQDELTELFTKVDKLEVYATLYKNGNMAKITDAFLDADKLEELFRDVLASLTQMSSTTKSNFVKKMLLDKLTRLRIVHAAFQEVRVQGGMRIRPWCVGFFGGTSVGKSTLAAWTMPLLLKANQFKFQDEYTVSINGSDSFMSTMKSDVDGVHVDELCNGSPQFTEGIPTKILTDLVNNARVYANMADLASKGKVALEPKIVITTKNVKNNLAHVYSIEPASIMRREDVVVTVDIKDEVSRNGMLDANLAAKYPKKGGVPDLWKLTVEEAVVTRNPNPTGFTKKDICTYQPVTHRGRELVDVSFAEFLCYAIHTSKRHFASQGTFVEEARQLGAKTEMCDTCKMPEAFCECPSMLCQICNNPELFCTCDSPCLLQEDTLSDIDEEEDVASTVEAVSGGIPILVNQSGADDFHIPQVDTRSLFRKHELSQHVADYMDVSFTKAWTAVDYFFDDLIDEVSVFVSACEYVVPYHYVRSFQGVYPDCDWDTAVQWFVVCGNSFADTCHIYGISLQEPGTETPPLSVYTSSIPEMFWPYLSDAQLPVDPGDVEPEPSTESEPDSDSDWTDVSPTDVTANLEGQSGYSEYGLSWFVDGVVAKCMRPVARTSTTWLEGLAMTGIGVWTLHTCGFFQPLIDLCKFAFPRGKYSNTMAEGFLASISSRWLKASKLWYTHAFADLDTCTTKFLYGHVKWLEKSAMSKWLNWMPDAVYNEPFVQDFIKHNQRRKVWKACCSKMLTTMAAAGAHLYYSSFNHRVVLYWFPVVCTVACLEYKQQEAVIVARIAEERKWLPETYKIYREDLKKSFHVICGVAGVLLAAAALTKVYSNLSHQANLQPRTWEEIEKKENDNRLELEAKQRNWFGFHLPKFGMTQSSATSTSTQVQNIVEKNLYHMTYPHPDDDNKICSTDVFFAEDGIGVIPAHLFRHKEEFVGTFTRNHIPGTTFKAWLSKNHSQKIPMTDLALVRVLNANSGNLAAGGSMKNITDKFPITVADCFKGHHVFRPSKGPLLVSPVSVAPHNSVVEGTLTCGFEYTLPYPTFHGLCIAPIITEGRGSVIAGFHTAGESGKNFGVASAITSKMYFDARIKLTRERALVPNCGVTPVDVMGKLFYESPEMHPKSPLGQVQGGTYTFLGSVKGRSTFHSSVHKTMISDTVEKVMEQPCLWGPPPTKKIDAWAETLKYLVEPTVGVPPSLLDRASKDYIKTLVDHLDTIPEVKTEIRPLTRVQNVSGVDGRRFIDGLKSSTSGGYMIGGPKSRFLTKLPATSMHQAPKALREDFWDEADKMEILYAGGYRTYPTFQACLKDEPTLFGKDKVRVFQGCLLPLQLQIRKYFLPIARYLSLFPTLSECGVGINVYGDEWEELCQYIEKFGKDRILAGDYSKYDLRMPRQLTLAAFDVLIAVAKASGNYSQEQLTIMEGIAADVTSPLVAYNGDWIQLYGSNPSGHNLTVYINSIVNSLLFRCGFFKMYPDMNFRANVALMTYGDDAKSSVSQACDDFNHISYAAFLEQYGMKFTMPDKTSRPVRFMHTRDADYLKMKSVYHPKLGLRLGALDEKSIFKPLHCVTRSEDGEITQACNNIEGAALDWFSHGEKVYEKRRAQLKEVAKHHKLLKWCEKSLNLTYDDRVKKFLKHYPGKI